MSYNIRGNAHIENRLSAGLAFNIPEWETGKNYIENDYFVDSGVIYLVSTAHTSTISPVADIANLDIVSSKDNQYKVVDSQLNFVTSEPAVPVEGIYWNNNTGTSSASARAVTENTYQVWDGTEWAEVAPVKGDLIYMSLEQKIYEWAGSGDLLQFPHDRIIDAVGFSFRLESINADGGTPFLNTTLKRGYSVTVTDASTGDVTINYDANGGIGALSYLNLRNDDSIARDFVLNPLIRNNGEPIGTVTIEAGKEVSMILLVEYDSTITETSLNAVYYTNNGSINAKVQTFADPGDSGVILADIDNGNYIECDITTVAGTEARVLPVPTNLEKGQLVHFEITNNAASTDPVDIDFVGLMTSTGETVDIDASSNASIAVGEKLSLTCIATSATELTVVNYENKASQGLTTQILTDGATVDWDTADGEIALLTTAESTVTINAPTNIEAGKNYVISITADADTTVTLNSIFYVEDGSKIYMEDGDVKWFYFYAETDSKLRAIHEPEKGTIYSSNQSTITPNLEGTSKFYYEYTSVGAVTINLPTSGIAYGDDFELHLANVAATTDLTVTFATDYINSSKTADIGVIVIPKLSDRVFRFTKEMLDDNGTLFKTVYRQSNTPYKIDAGLVEYDSNGAPPSDEITEGSLVFDQATGRFLLGTANGGVASIGHRLDGRKATISHSVTDEDLLIFDNYASHSLELSDGVDRNISVASGNVAALEVFDVFRIYVGNTGTTTTNVVFSTEFQTAGHKTMPVIAVEANEFLSFTFIVETDGTNNILTQIDGYEKSTGGGLTQAGNLPASITEQGIYTAEGTETAVDLYAATGSQDRVMVTSLAAGVGTVISVQSGESLNGATDGTYTTQSDGEVLLFIDNGVGEWTVQVVGASQATDMEVEVGSLTSQGTATAVTILSDGLTWNDIIASYDRVRFEVFETNTKNIGSTTIATADIVDNVEVSFAGDTLGTLVSPGVYSRHVKLNAETTGAVDISYGSGGISLNVRVIGIKKQSTVVLAGMVVPESLSHGSVVIPAQSTSTGAWSDVVDGEYNLENAGKYLLTASGEAHATVNLAGVLFRIVDSSDNEISGSSFTCEEDSFFGKEDGSSQVQVTIASPEVYKLQYSVTSGTGNILANQFAISWNQLPSSTVVNPEGLVPEDLARAKMSQSVAQSLPGNSETNIEMDATVYETNTAVIEADHANEIFQLHQAGWYNITANISVTNSVNNASYTVRIKEFLTGKVLASQRISNSIQQVGTIFNVSTGPVQLGGSAQVYVTYETNEANARVLTDGAESNWISIEQLPTSTVVNPEGLVPESLHVASIATNSDQHSNTTNTAVGSGYATISFSDVHIITTTDIGGMLNMTDNTVDIQQDGLYRLDFSGRFAASYDMSIRVDGAIVAGTDATSTVDNNSCQVILNLIAGQRVEFAGSVATSTSAVQGAAISVQQLPTATVTMIDNGIDDVLSKGQALTADRTIDLGTNSLTLDGSSGDILFANSGAITATAFNLPSETIVHATGVNVVPDKATAVNYAVIVGNFSTGDIVIDPALNWGFDDSPVVFRINNLDPVARNIVFDAEYKGRNGNSIGTIVIPAGDELRFSFSYVKAGDFHLVETSMNEVSSGGGLTQAGIVPAAITVQGIYTAEGTNATSPLYAATGSQDRVMVTSTATGVGTVITVPAGESLNGSLNGTYTTQSDGEVLLFIDNGVGEWVVQVVGASQQTALQMVSLNTVGAKDIVLDGSNHVVLTQGSGESEINYVYDPNSLVSGNTIVIQNDGHYEINASMTGNTDVSCSFSLLLDEVEVASAEAVYGLSVNRTMGSISYIGNLTAGTVIAFTFENLADHDSFNATIQQLPTSVAVLAGMVVPEDLEFQQQTVTADHSGGEGTLAGVSMTVGNTGLYLVSVYGIANLDNAFQDINEGGSTNHVMSDNKSAAYVKMYIDGSDPTEGNVEVKFSTQGAVNDQFRGSASEVVQLTAGQVLTLVGYSEGSVNHKVELGTRLTIQQQPNSTVVNPEGLVPEDLHYVSANVVGEGTSVSNVGGKIDLRSANFNSIYDPQGLILGDDIVIELDGTYEIIATGGNSNTSAREGVQIHIDGVRVAQASSPNGSAEEDASAATWLGNLSAGQLVSFTTRSDLAIKNFSYTVKQLPSATVQMIDNGTEVNDQSTSGYMDIGDMRMQWGYEVVSVSTPGPFTLTYPQPFLAGTTPSVQFATKFNQGTNNAQVRIEGVPGATSVGCYYSITSPAVISGYSWFVIGQKP